jgi:type VII secretion protein EccB
MPSRQDQLHSHQFAVQRVVSAMVTREPDPVPSPWRRIGGAAVVGILLAALSIGAVAVYGLLAPGGSGRWKHDDVVIVEKDTGAVYVHRGDRLHPVANFTSARLIVGVANARTVQVSRGSIASVPRGTPLGLAGAPASLPAKEKLRREPWTVCTHRPDGGTPQSVLYVGGSGPGRGAALGDRAVLVSAGDDGVFLVWRDRRYRVSPAALAALAWTQRAVQPVSVAFLNALRAGADLDRPALGRRGDPVRRMPGLRVGQVLAVERAGGGDDLYVAVPEGLASITRLQADLLLGDPSGGQAVPARMSRAQLSQYLGGTPAPALDPVSGDGAPPAAAPQLVTTAGVVCLGSGGVSVDVSLGDLGGAVAPGSRSATGAVLADRIVVAPGSGALVESGGALGLVTDLGVRYPVPSIDVAAVLGYANQQPVRVPPELSSLVPVGVALDPVAAAMPLASHP